MYVCAGGGGGERERDRDREGQTDRHRDYVRIDGRTVLSVLLHTTLVLDNIDIN